MTAAQYSMIRLFFILGTVYLIFKGGGGAWVFGLGQDIFFGQNWSKIIFFAGPSDRIIFFFS